MDAASSTPESVEIKSFFTVDALALGCARYPR